jgi:hypothetical protein
VSPTGVKYPLLLYCEGIFMYLLFFALLFLPHATHSMETKHSLDTHYTVELKHGITKMISPLLIRTSNTLHKQRRRTKSTHLKAPDVSSHGLELFYQASCTEEKKFPQFFMQLSPKDKKILINTAGKSHLNSPCLTALLVQSYFPKDIQSLIANYCSDMRHNIDYHMRSSMIRSSNLQDKISTDTRTTVPYDTKLLLFDNGRMLITPKFFTTTPMLCSGSSYYKMSMSTTDITVSYCGEKKPTVIPAETMYNVIARFQYNDIEYALTLDSFNRKNLLLWKNNNDEEYLVQKIALSSPFKTATVSNDGSYIIIKSDQTLLCTIHCSSTTDVCSVKSITPQSNIYTSAVLNHSNNIFVLPVTHRKNFNILLNQSLFITQLLFYHLNEESFTKVEHDGSCIGLAYSYDGRRLIALMHCATISQDKNTICIYDTANENAISLITEFMCEKELFPIKIHSSPYDNHFIVSCKNGDLLLFKESNDHEYIIKHYKQDDFSSSINDFFTQEVLFTPDKHFAFTHINYYANLNTPDEIDASPNPRRPVFKVFDLSTQTCLGSARISNSVTQYKPLIALHKDLSCVWTNSDSDANGVWQQCKLYSPDEARFLKWLKIKPTLFQLYALNRLRIAHNNQEDLIPTCDAHNIVHSFDKEHSDIQTCIKKYLFIQENEESIFEKIKNFFLSDS